jgi:hypothetical protein
MALLRSMTQLRRVPGGRKHDTYSFLIVYAFLPWLGAPSRSAVFPVVMGVRSTDYRVENCDFALVKKGRRDFVQGAGFQLIRITYFQLETGT